MGVSDSVHVLWGEVPTRTNSGCQAVFSSPALIISDGLGTGLTPLRGSIVIYEHGCHTEKGHDVIDYIHYWKGNQPDLNPNTKRHRGDGQNLSPKPNPNPKLLERRPRLSC